ncbi:MAG: zf-HC2 domain-containing protein [Chloroflexi bacterium]|nr:MAG: zf-HC2 domain-containing protein [Chloroflexota bacterium]
MENERLIMRCSKAAEQLQLYIDKRLPLEKMRLLELHLSQCNSCQQALFCFEKIDQALCHMEMVAEPADLTSHIMRRVAHSVQQNEEVHPYVLFQPSLTEWLAALLLATITTLGIILGQPSLRATLPIANGHDAFSYLCINLWNNLMSLNSATLMLAFWIVGTILGVWITLLVAGSEMRALWLKAMISRLPVW